MFELMALAGVGLLLLALVGALASVAALVCWLLFLPFKLLAFVFKGLSVLLLLPLLLIVGLAGGIAVGIPLLIVLAITVGPFVLLFLGLAWLARRVVRGTHSTA
jgi:hypothetical protein